MAAISSLILAATAAAAAGTVGEAIASSAHDQKREADIEMNKIKSENERVLKDQKAKEAEQAAIDDGAKKQQAARSKQRSMALASQGRRGTILTSPLGAMGDPGQVQRKTLLGQ